MAEGGSDIAARLRRWLRGRGVEDEVELLGRATVGLSQETWFVRVGSGSGAVAAVLRLPTPASGKRAILTQIAALRAVAGRVPAPSVLWFEAGEENPFGRPFLLMERIEGEVPVGWHTLGEDRRTALAEAAVDAMAALHRQPPPRRDDGGTLVSPTDLDFFAARLDRFEELPAVLRGALWWLRRNRPEPAEPVFVHGDLRMGNMVAVGDRLAAVLDWEMAGAGDPLADLAWCFIPLWERPGVDEAAMLRRYGERRGAAVDPDLFLWHRVLGYVRLAYYGLSGTRAFDRGHSNDLRLGALRLQLPVHLDRLARTLAGQPVTT